MTIQSTEKRSRVRYKLSFLLGAAVFAGILVFFGGPFGGGDQAWAIVGRPLTPVSYAGVARRTTRRTVRRTAAVTYPAGTMTTLAPGCVAGAGTYQCGGAAYRPYYHGPNLVYVPVQ